MRLLNMVYRTRTAYPTKNGLVFILLILIMNPANSQVNFTSSEIVGRPTNSSITINVIADAAIDAYFQYGTQAGNYTNQTSIVSASANQAIETVISGLQSNTLYYYRMAFRASGTSSWTFKSEHHFRTQRAAGSSFVFDIISDEHVNMAGLSTETIFANTISNMIADNPDFVLSLGDMFSANTTQSGIESDYKNFRGTLSSLLSSSPLFYAIGNHENEEGWFQFTTNPDRRIYGVNARKLYYLNPVPDAFYSGDNHNYSSQGVTGDGLRESYFSFEWGDALFVFLDPYWNTINKPYNATVGNDPNPSTITNDIWDWTLGVEQYTWLYQTLSNSTKSYKFVFAHQVAGGTTTYGRSGVKAIDAGYEWGGGTNWNQTGSDWNNKRPASAGWTHGPIHKMLVDQHASAFFHGHDHCYVMESRDGIVYQECPQAGISSGNGFFSTSPPSSITNVNHAYYDPAGVNHPNGGHIRLTVSSSQTTVEYVRTFTSGGTNGSISHTYNIYPNSGTPANTPPVANAGPDQNIIDTGNNGSENVTLNGSGSSDSDGTISAYVWKENGNQIASGVSPVVSLSVGTHNIELSVTDDDNATGTDNLTITVTSPSSNSNVSLLGSYVAGLSHAKEAGSSRSLVFTAHAEHYGTMSLTSVTYGGQAMTKVAERSQGSGWSQIYTAIFILNEAGINAASGNTFTPVWNISSSWWSATTPNAVNYSSAFFKDADQNSMTGNVAVNGVNNQTTVSASALINNAGDMVIAASTCSNNGTYNMNNGFTKGIELTVTSADGVCGYKQGTGANETPSVTQSISGNHAIAAFVLKSGNQVIQNVPPVANAGPDQTVIDFDLNNTENVSLNGSGSSDADGSIVNYSWSENGSQIAAGVSPVVSFSLGTHTVSLTVTDDSSATNTDAVTIIVKLPNILPVANAGNDQTLVDTDHSGSEAVSLNGSGSSDADGNITSYIWKENGSQIASGVSPSVNLSVGTHAIVLTVTDNDNGSHTDTVTITVNAAPVSNTTVALLGSWVQGLTHATESGSNRALIFTAHAEHYGSMSLTSVSFGGQAMTKVTEFLNNTYSNQVYTAVFILNEAGLAIASGNTFTPTWNISSSWYSSSTTPNAVNYSSAFFSGVNQGTLTGAVNAKGGSFATSVSTNALNTSNGDMVILASSGSNSGTYSVNNSFTKGIELSLTSADGVTGQKAASGVNETPKVTHSTYSLHAIAGFVLKAYQSLGSPYYAGRNSQTILNNDAGSAGNLNVYPNPSNGYMTIAYTVTQESPVSLNIYGLEGKLIRNCFAQPKSPGHYKYCWDGKSEQGISVKPGIYLGIFREDLKEEVIKILLQ